MKLIVLFLILTFLMVLFNNVLLARERAFEEVAFIDHQNFRYFRTTMEIPHQIGEIKKNLGYAADLGIDSYVLFTRETLEAMLTYDFYVSEIGNIGEQAFSEGSRHRTDAEFLREHLSEVIQYAKDRGIDVFFHNNQFQFPEQVMSIIRPHVWGDGGICPGRDITWEIFRGKIHEFFTLFPDISGIQITADEIQYSVLDCKCNDCHELSDLERVNLLTIATAEAAAIHGKEAHMRTWQRMGELRREEPSKMFDGVPNNVIMSIKNTRGDYKIPRPFDDEIIGAGDASRQIVEFDAWREYEGFNYFPAYMGDIWAPRIKEIYDRGIRRIAVRLMWNSHLNPIFERPWGNYVNIYTFLALAENPYRNPDEILKEFVEKYYPNSSWEAAFKLYKYSSVFQETLYYIDVIDMADHSRLHRTFERAERALDTAQSRGFLTDVEDFHKRREEMDNAYSRVQELIESLCQETPREWKDELKRGARIQWFTATGIMDQLEVVFWTRNIGRYDLSQLRRRIGQNSSEWSSFDRESYNAMHGGMAAQLLGARWIAQVIHYIISPFRR